MVKGDNVGAKTVVLTIINDGNIFTSNSSIFLALTLLYVVPPPQINETPLLSFQNKVIGVGQRLSYSVAQRAVEPRPPLVHYVGENKRRKQAMVVGRY